MGFWSTLDKKADYKWILILLKHFQKNRSEDIIVTRVECELGIQDKVVSVIEYVPNEEVYKYFQVSDVLFVYEYAPSGVNLCH